MSSCKLICWLLGSNPVLICSCANEIRVPSATASTHDLLLHARRSAQQHSSCDVAYATHLLICLRDPASGIALHSFSPGHLCSTGAAPKPCPACGAGPICRPPCRRPPCMCWSDPRCGTCHAARMSGDNRYHHKDRRGQGHGETIKQPTEFNTRVRASVKLGIGGRVRGSARSRPCSG